MANDPYTRHLFDKVPGEWWDRGACKGRPSEWWFPERAGRQSQMDVAKAKAVCATCDPEVREACLAFAESEPVERFGVWGGKTETERKRLRKKGVRR